MRLTVRSEKGIRKLTFRMVVLVTIFACLFAHIMLRLLLPPESAPFHGSLFQTATIVTVVTCVLITTPFGIFVGRSLLTSYQLQQQLAEMATTDNLTGLMNRAAVLASIGQAVTDSNTNQKRGTALFVDLDHFKKINDTYGHAGGDAALRHAAGIMRTVLGENAILGRFGGEEFVCFIESADNAPAKAAEIIMTFRESSAMFGNQTIPVKASIGLANTDDLSDAAHILSCADEALYIAKSSGRDCIVSYDQVKSLRLVAESVDDRAKRRSSDRSQMPRSLVA